MKRDLYRPFALGCLLLAAMASMRLAEAATPSARQALKLMPVQKGVDFDQPDAEKAAQCTITPQKTDGRVGWIVEDSDGRILRCFLDTNGDNVVDQWSYYKEGLEVYRDIDTDFNGKADQYRWFHTAGSRWGLDKNEDGKIDSWKTISAEEVTAEIVKALATQDTARFDRVALSTTDLKSLGLGPERSKALAKKLAELSSKFESLAVKQQTVTPTSRWVQFSGNQPGIVPAGTDGSTRDLKVYENVIAIVQSKGQHNQVQIGTLIDLGAAGWRVIDAPQPLSELQDKLTVGGFFFRSPATARNQPASGGPSPVVQRLLDDLEKLDAASARASTPKEQARLQAQRADLLEQIAQKADRPEDRVLWLRQLADTVSAAVQSGSYPDGAKRLKSLFERLQKTEGSEDLAAYVRFRQLTADYGLSLQAEKADFGKIQSEWLKNLETYVKDYPDGPDTSEALLQLAIAQEFAGQEAEAKKWYGQITKRFPQTPAGRKAHGALTRLDSVGKQIKLTGKSPSGKPIDLAQYRGRVVLIQYWATWCEPCKADMADLKELVAKYGRSGFEIIGVNLDTSREAMAKYLAENRLPWPQIHEDGGLDSRPANELGILTLPTMILIGPDGKVLNRSIRVTELDRELKRIIRR